MGFSKRKSNLSPSLHARINSEKELYEICKRDFIRFSKTYAHMKWESIDFETTYVPSFYKPKYGLDEKRDKVMKVMKSKAFQRLPFTRNELFDEAISFVNPLGSLPENFNNDISVENKENSSQRTSVLTPQGKKNMTHKLLNPHTPESGENEMEFKEIFQKKLPFFERLDRSQPFDERNTKAL
ncbi:hypothetical protein ACTXT7_014560 [Hymenolepis weldensis]